MGTQVLRTRFSERSPRSRESVLQPEWTRRRVAGGLLSFGFVLATSGCFGDFGRSGDHDRSSGVGDQDGTVRLQLATVAGIDIQQVSYSIQAPGGEPLEGTVEITGENQSNGILIENLPVATGVSIALKASASNDVTCAGEGTVDVVAGQTAAVSIVLQCKLPDGALLPGTGSINVQATVNLCPQVLTASAEAAEGGFSVAATAGDKDGDTLTFAWTAAQGSFAAASAATTTYACGGAGDQTLTVTVSDGEGCTATKDVVVTCAPTAVPPEQTPPEQTPPEQTPPEQTPPEQTPPEQTPPEQTPPEQTPPEQTPPEQTPPEQTPPEQTPPEQTPPEQTPPEQTPPAEGTELPCDVKTVLEQRCQGCHGAPPAGAPMPLVTLADLRAESEPGKYYYQLVAERIQSDTRPMPPKGLPALEDAERATLLAWIDAGALGTDAVCEAPTQ